MLTNALLAFVRPTLAVGMWPRDRHDDIEPLSGLFSTLRKDNAQMRVLLNKQSVIETLIILVKDASVITMQRCGIWSENAHHALEADMQSKPGII